MGYGCNDRIYQKPFHHPLPKNKNDWVHSVIFEPQPKMQLTHSSYKINFISRFSTFPSGFQLVDTYIRNLMKDIANPADFRRLVAPFHDTLFIFGTNESNVMKFLKSPGCAACPYACRSKLKFDQYNLEIQYIYKYSMQYIRNS